MPTASRASAKVTTVPTGMVRPLVRRTRANATATRSTAASSATQDRLAHQVAHSGRPNPLLVLAVLEHRAERGIDSALVELGATEHGQRGGPVDRLGDARRLVQLHVAELLHGGGHLS